MRPAALLTTVLAAGVLWLMAACGPQPAATVPPAPTPTPTPVTEATPPPATPPANGAPAGQQVFIDMGCGACHTLQGVPGAMGAVGPELTNIGTVAETRDPPLSAEEYIRRAIEDPGAFVVPGFPPGLMPPLRGQMSDQQFEALVEFLLQQQ